MSRLTNFAAIALLSVTATSGRAQSADGVPFPPFEQWKTAVLAGDAAGLKAFYSTDPPAEVNIARVKGDASSDTTFWLGLKAKGLRVEIIRQIVRSDRAGIIFSAAVQSGLPNAQTVNVTDDQFWLKQGDQWRLVGVERTDAPRLKQPSDMNKDIYPASADAHAEIKDAEAEGQQQGEHEYPEHDFGLALEFQQACCKQMAVAGPSAVARSGSGWGLCGDNGGFVGNAHRFMSAVYGSCPEGRLNPGAPRRISIVPPARDES